MKYFSLFILSLLYLVGFSQEDFNVKGYVLNTNNEGISFASIEVLNANEGVSNSSQYGVSTDVNGRYELVLDNGYYSVVISAVGYKTQKINLIVENKDQTKNIYLEEETVDLGEVIIKRKRRDPAYEIIKQAIDRKKENQFVYNTSESDLYIKAFMRPMNKEEIKQTYHKFAAKQEQDSIRRIQQAREEQRKKWAENTFSDSTKNNTDSLVLDTIPPTINQYQFFDKEDLMSMAEAYTRRYYQAGKDVKEIREAFKTTGNYWNLFYLTSSEADFDFYNNLIDAELISNQPLISPLSKASAIPYKFKLVKSYVEDGKYIHHIAVSPRRKPSPLFEGEIHILDGSFAIYKIDLKLSPFGLNYYDQFRIEQKYQHLGDSAWVIENQKFTYHLKEYKQVGSTNVQFSNYEFNKSYPKKFFNNALLITTQEAVSKSTSFWDSIRPEPLSEEQIKLQQYVDSVYMIEHSKAFLDSVDSVNNRLTVADMINVNYSIYIREKRETHYLPTAFSLINPFSVIGVGGYRSNLDYSYIKTFDSEKAINIYPSITYGHLNKDWNYGFESWALIDPMKPTNMYLNFSKEYQSISNNFGLSLEQASLANFYQDEGGYIGFRRELFNGFYTSLGVSFSRISSIDHIEGYHVVNQFFNNITPLSFESFNQLENTYRIEYQPNQKYYLEPKRKVVLGSKWPVFRLNLVHGVSGVVQSKYNYLNLDFGFSHNIKIGVIGKSEYSMNISRTFGEGSDIFLSRKVFIQSDNYFLQDPLGAFSALDTTVFTRDWTVEGHYYHDFNTVLLNQVPLLRKLKLENLVGGSVLYTKEQDLFHLEIYAGVSKSFKLFGARVNMGIYPVAKVGTSGKTFDTALKFGMRMYYREERRWTWQF